MFIDAQTQLWDATALSSDAVSTNTYDLGVAGNSLSVGEPMVAIIQVDVAADFTSANETYQFNLLQSANADLSSADILSSIVRTAAQLTAGSLHAIPLPAGAETKRYIGLGYDGGGTTPTITVTAWIAPQSMMQRDMNYPDGFTIS